VVSVYNEHKSLHQTLISLFISAGLRIFTEWWKKQCIRSNICDDGGQLPVWIESHGTQCGTFNVSRYVIYHGSRVSGSGNNNGTSNDKFLYNNNNNNNNNNNSSIEMLLMWNVKCFVIPIIIWATGIVSKGLKISESNTRTAFNRSYTKNWHTRNITHCNECTTLWDWCLSGAVHHWLKWRIAKKKKNCDKIITIIIIIIIIQFFILVCCTNSQMANYRYSTNKSKNNNKNKNSKEKVFITTW
jgi:hypothetical protein